MAGQNHGRRDLATLQTRILRQNRTEQLSSGKEGVMEYSINACRLGHSPVADLQAGA